MQLALNVANIDDAVTFYSRLFNTTPAKVRPGYANFAVADPSLKLVLIEDPTQTPGSLNHLGVEVASTDDVSAAQARLAAAGLATAAESRTECCYALQDKVWVEGPGGEAWEIYTVLADAEMPAGQLRADNASAAACCATRPDLAGAEFIGSALLTSVVVGSGIAAQRLSPGDIGLELLENAAATAAGLYVLILTFGAVSGAHFNPVVTLADVVLRGTHRRDAVGYLTAQFAGCGIGAVVANLMYDDAAINISTHHRASGAHLLSEVVATFGLLLIIFALARNGRGHSTPAAVGSYIGAAYFFTSSTSFANPAIAVGRMLSNTFAGIAPVSVPAFIGAEFAGATLAVVVVKALYPVSASETP